MDTVLPVAVERGLAVAQEQVRDAILAVPRTDEVHVVVREHHWKEEGVDVPLPERVALPSLVRDRLAGVRRTRIQARPPVLDVQKDGGAGKRWREVGEALRVEVALARLPVPLHPRHEIVPVKLGDGRGRGRDEEKEAARGNSLHEPVEQVGGRELILREYPTLMLEELLRGRRKRWSEARGVLLGRDKTLLGHRHFFYLLRCIPVIGNSF